MINYVNSIFSGFQNKQMNLLHQKYPGRFPWGLRQCISEGYPARQSRGIFHKKYQRDYAPGHIFLCPPDGL